MRIAKGPWSRALSFGGIAILVLIQITTAQHSQLSGGVLLANIVATALVVGAWVLLLETHSDGNGIAVTALIVTLGVGSIALVVFSPQGAAIIATIVALSTAANRFGRTAGTVYAVALIAAFLTATVLRLGVSPVGLLSYGLGLSFAFLASRSVAQLRQEQSRTKALLHELQASRDAQVHSAAINERVRIAREIHDVLAHTLAALAVQLEGARLMLEQRGTDPDALASVERALRLAKEGLDETRQAVSAFRGDQMPGPDQLTQLVDEFRRDSGTAAALRVEGVPRNLSPEARLALYRTAQEALTNVRRHAQAERVEVVLRHEPQGTELEVTDAGEVTPTNGGGGFGLLGMRERAELAGGTLDAGPVGGGFRVRLWLPA
ncbi:MAG: sensor histidine kinase [Candidatus Dormibacteraceae bacterium]